MDKAGEGQKHGVLGNLTLAQLEQQAEDTMEECETCMTEIDEFGQQHFCACGEEISDEQCDEWGGLCSVCSWGIKN